MTNTMQIRELSTDETKAVVGGISLTDGAAMFLEFLNGEVGMGPAIKAKLGGAVGKAAKAAEQVIRPK